MIVAEQIHDLEQSGMGRTVQAKIKASRKLFSFFSDGVYSNKPVAIARELVANAIDSHVMAGRPNVPVDVVLPTVLEPTFIVRDFGIGMSEDFLFNNYLVYAEGSTKDGSNEAIGGFGIGKAAVFSYTDQFSLVSVQDGVKGVYSVFVGEDGIPAISQIAVTTTDDHNGVEISFPVEDKDIQLFHEAAQTALQFFNPLPNITNGTVTPPTYSFVGNNWALRPDAGELGVILGGVRYPVLSDSLSREMRNDQKLGPLLKYGIDLTMPIGSVSIALSREALSYNDVTNAGIQKSLLAIFDDVKSTFGTMFDQEPSWWAAAKKLFKETGSTNSYSRNAHQQLLAANAVYKGKQLVTQLEVTNLSGAKLWVVEGKRSWGRQPSIKAAKWQSFHDVRMLVPGTTETVVVDNMPASPKSKVGQRLQEFLSNAPRTGMIIVVRPTMPTDLSKAPPQAEIDQVLNNLGNPEVLYTADLPLPITTAKQAKVAGVRPKVRMFRYDGSNKRSGWGSSDITNLTPGGGKTVQEIKYVDQPATGIMVVMDSFELPKDFRTKMATGLVKYSEVVFVNKIDEPKLDQFKNFNDVFAERLKPALKALPKDINERLALEAEKLFGEIFNRFNQLVGSGISSLSLTDAQKETPFGKIITLWSTKVRRLDGDQSKFKPFLSPALPAGLDPAALLKDLKSTQPEVVLMLELLTPQYGGSNHVTSRHLALLTKLI